MLEIIYEIMYCELKAKFVFNSVLLSSIFSIMRCLRMYLKEITNPDPYKSSERIVCDLMFTIGFIEM